MVVWLSGCLRNRAALPCYASKMGWVSGSSNSVFGSEVQSNYRLWRRYIVAVHAVTGKVVLNRHRGLEMEAKKTEPQRENGIGWKDKDAKRPVGWLCQWWVQTTVVMTKELSRNRELQAISIFGVASNNVKLFDVTPPPPLTTTMNPTVIFHRYHRGSLSFFVSHVASWQLGSIDVAGRIST